MKYHSECYNIFGTTGKRKQIDKTKQKINYYVENLVSDFRMEMRLGGRSCQMYNFSWPQDPNLVNMSAP